MSNVLQLFDPNEFKGGSAPEFAAVKREDYTRIGDLVGSSYGLIRCRGGKWTLSYQGQDYLFKKDGHAAPTLQVIILRVAPFKSKTFYKKLDLDSKNPPDCSSLRGDVPDANVPNRQADNCALCPQNERKMQPHGKEGRACRDSMRLSVVLVPFQTEPFFDGAALLDPVFLRVPADSFKNLLKMDEQMDKMGLSYYEYVTEISFDPSTSYPKMVFRAIKKLPSAEATFIVDLLNGPDVKRVTGEAGFGGPKLVQLAPPPEQSAGFGQAAIGRAQTFAPAQEILPPQKPVQQSLGFTTAKRVEIDALPETNGGGERQPVATTIAAPAVDVDVDDGPADPNLDDIVKSMVGSVKAHA